MALADGTGAPVVALTGAGTPLGTRVVRGLVGIASTVIVLDDDAHSVAAARLAGQDGLQVVAGPDPAGAAVFVHLASGPAPSPMGPALDDEARAARLDDLATLLSAADGVAHVVLLSSAVVYGAWPGNAVPLSEDAPVRPDPAFGWALELAEAERMVGDWAAHLPGLGATILRPALVVAPDDDAFLVRALGGWSGVRAVDEPRKVQFVHVEDVADAVVLAVTRRLSGAFNVAPEGWISDKEATALAGHSLPRPALPSRLVAPARRLGWRLGLGHTPPDVAAYVTNPWVVAADRLRARGWQAQHTNEEALVETTQASVLATLSPRRRQELLLGGVVAIAVALVGGTFGALSLRRRR